MYQRVLIFLFLLPSAVFAAPADDVGIFGDILNDQLTTVRMDGLSELVAQTYLGQSGAKVKDLAIDASNRRLYALTDSDLRVFDIEGGDGAAAPALTLLDPVVSHISGEQILLTNDSRRAFISGKGRVTSINLFDEIVIEDDEELLKDAYTDIHVYPLSGSGGELAWAYPQVYDNQSVIGYWTSVSMTAAEVATQGVESIALLLAEAETNAALAEAESIAAEAFKVTQAQAAADAQAASALAAATATAEGTPEAIAAAAVAAVAATEAATVAAEATIVAAQDATESIDAIDAVAQIQAQHDLASTAKLAALNQANVANSAITEAAAQTAATIAIPEAANVRSALATSRLQANRAFDSVNNDPSVVTTRAKEQALIAASSAVEEAKITALNFELIENQQTLAQASKDAATAGEQSGVDAVASVSGLDNTSAISPYAESAITAALVVEAESQSAQDLAVLGADAVLTANEAATRAATYVLAINAELLRANSAKALADQELVDANATLTSANTSGDSVKIAAAQQQVATAQTILSDVASDMLSIDAALVEATDAKERASASSAATAAPLSIINNLASEIATASSTTFSNANVVSSRVVETPWDYTSRDVKAMAIHPDGSRLIVVIGAEVDRLDIANDRLVGEDTSALVELPDDFGYITEIDLTSDVLFGEARADSEFRSPIAITEPVLRISDLSISADGNLAYITARGGQTVRATPFGIMPTSDEDTGGIVVYDLNNRRILGLIPTTVAGENTAELRKEMVHYGWQIKHPDVQVAQQNEALSAAKFLVIGGTPSGLAMTPQYLTEYLNNSYIANLLTESYQDFGYMAAYSEMYPKDMVGASSVGLSPTGELAVVTIQDTNNLGLIQTALSNELRGYRSNPGFEIDFATGRTINGLYLDYTTYGYTPPESNYSWLAPRRVRFSPSGNWAFVGMSGGVPNQTTKDNFIGAINAVALKAEMMPGGLLDQEAPPPGISLINNAQLVAAHKVATYSLDDVDGDGLSNQLEAFNRWNDYRVVVHGDKNRLAGSDAASIANPADAALPYAGGIDCLDKLFYLPHSGPGYRFNYSGLPRYSANAANRAVVSTIERVGLDWHKAYLDTLAGKGTGFPVTRPYFVVGHMSQPGGAPLKDITGEPIHYSSRNGFQVSFPYLKVDSDASHDFVLSNDPSTPRDNSIASPPEEFDLAHAEALIQFLLNENVVTRIGVDPQIIELLPSISESDPKIEVHGSLEIANTRRDLDSQIIATFACLEVDLDIDSDNDGTINGSGDEDDLEGSSVGLGKLVSVNNGDEDNDQIPDYADGFDFKDNEGAGASAVFTELKITFPSELDFSKIEFQITYPESKPSDLRRVGAGTNEDPYRYVLPDSGYFRIWTKDGDASRLMAEIDSGGDFIASATRYAAIDLTGGTSVTVYIEAVGHTEVPANNDFIIEIFANDDAHSVYSLMDTVNVTAGPFIEFIDNQETTDGQDMLPLFNPAPYVVLDPIPDPGIGDNPSITVTGTVTSYLFPLEKEQVFVNGQPVETLAVDSDGTDGLGPFVRKFQSEQLPVGNNDFVILAWAVNSHTAYGADSAFISVLRDSSLTPSAPVEAVEGSIDQTVMKTRTNVISERKVIEGSSIPKERIEPSDFKFRTRYVNLKEVAESLPYVWNSGQGEVQLTLEKVAQGIYESKDLYLIPEDAEVPESASDAIKESRLKSNLGAQIIASISTMMYTGEDLAIPVGVVTRAEVDDQILELVQATNRANITLNGMGDDISRDNQFHIYAGLPGESGRSIEVELTSSSRNDRVVLPRYSEGFPMTTQQILLTRLSDDSEDPNYNLYKSEEPVLALSQALPPTVSTDGANTHFVIPGGFMSVVLPNISELVTYQNLSNKEYVAGIMALDADGDNVEGALVSNPVPIVELDEARVLSSEDGLMAQVTVRGRVRDPIADMFDLPATDLVHISVQGDAVENITVIDLPGAHAFAPYPKEIQFEVTRQFAVMNGTNALVVEVENAFGNLGWGSTLFDVEVILPPEIEAPRGSIPGDGEDEPALTSSGALIKYFADARITFSNVRIEDEDLIGQKYYPIVHEVYDYRVNANNLGQATQRFDAITTSPLPDETIEIEDDGTGLIQRFNYAMLAVGDLQQRMSHSLADRIIIQKSKHFAADASLYLSRETLGFIATKVFEEHPISGSIPIEAETVVKFSDKIHKYYTIVDFVANRRSNRRAAGTTTTIEMSASGIRADDELLVEVRKDGRFFNNPIDSQIIVGSGLGGSDGVSVDGEKLTVKMSIPKEAEYGDRFIGIKVGGDAWYKRYDVKKSFAVDPLRVVIIAVDGLSHDNFLHGMEQLVNGAKSGSLEGVIGAVGAEMIQGFVDNLDGDVGTIARMAYGLAGDVEAPLPTAFDKIFGENFEHAVKLSNEEGKQFEVRNFLPTVTWANWASVFTGKPPSETGITGLTFFPREIGNQPIWSSGVAAAFDEIPSVYEGLKKPGFRTDFKDMLIYAGSGGLDYEGLGEAPLTPPTLYEQAQAYGMESYVASNMISRGAEKVSSGVMIYGLMGLDLAGPTLFKTLNEKVHSLHNHEYLVDFTDTVERVLDDGGFGRSHGRPFGMLMDFGVVNGLSSVALQHDMPDLMTCYLAGTDATIHGEGLEHGNEFFWKYSDSAFWMLYKILQIRGYDQSTLFVLTSDHGLSNVNQQAASDSSGNHLPVFTEDVLPAIENGEPWSYTITVNDQDGEFVLLELDQVAIDMGMSLIGNTLDWTPSIPEEYVFSVYADDGQGNGKSKLTLKLPVKLIGTGQPESAQVELSDRYYYDQSVVALYDDDGLDDDVGPALNGLGLTVWGYVGEVLPEAEEFSPSTTYRGDNISMEVNSVYSPNGGMSHIYIKKTNTNWQFPSSLDRAKNLEVASWFAQQNETLGSGFYKRFAAVLYRSADDWAPGGGEYQWAEWTGSPEFGNVIPKSLGVMSGRDKYEKWDIDTRLPELSAARSGDVILIMGETEVDGADNRYLGWHWEAEQFKGFHGEPDPSSSKVPLVFAFPGGDLDFIETALNNSANRVAKNGDYTNADLTPVLMEIIKKTRIEKHD